MTKLRSAFCGTPAIAVPALRVLARHSDIAVVVTQPDRPAGRGNQLREPEVKSAALDLGLTVWQPETLRGAEGDVRLHGLDLIVVMAYGELLRQPVLDLPRSGCINLHASLLPRWRGASPLQAALRAGDPQSGITVMRMVRALDAGPIFLTESVPIVARMTLSELHDALAIAAATALERFLAAPLGAATPQDEALVTVCRKLTPADGHLDFTRPAIELERWVRAYTPAPGCWAIPDGGERLRILQVEPSPSITGLACGMAAINGPRMLVGCGDGAIEIVRLQPAGKRAMSAAEFINGHRAPTLLT